MRKQSKAFLGTLFIVVNRRQRKRLCAAIKRLDPKLKHCHPLVAFCGSDVAAHQFILAAQKFPQWRLGLDCVQCDRMPDESEARHTILCVVVQLYVANGCWVAFLEFCKFVCSFSQLDELVVAGDLDGEQAVDRDHVRVLLPACRSE